MHAVNTTCHVCNGTGRIPKKFCPVCGGHGVKTTQFNRTVTVPAGAPTGHQVTFNGQGAEAPRFLPGNLIFIVSLLPHPRFEVVGRNLLHRARISLVDALLGFTRKLTLPTGKVLRVEHLGDATDRLTFRGEGLPKMGEAGDARKNGDVIVEFDVQFPRRLSDRQLGALRDGGMSGTELAMLEKVIRLAAAKDEEGGMDERERAHTRQCALDPLLCAADPLYFLRDGGGESHDGHGGNRSSNQQQ